MTAGERGFSFAVMSGGEGRRFGSDKTKALLFEKPLYMYAVETGLSLTDDVMLVSREPLKYEPFLEGVSYLADEYPCQCPMAGMMTAGRHAKYEKVFVLSADAPLFSAALVSYIVEKGEGHDAVIPVIDGKNYNLAALYSAPMLKNFEKYYYAGVYKLTECYGDYDVMFLNESLIPSSYKARDAFLNVNTTQDLERAGRIISAGKLF